MLYPDWLFNLPIPKQLLAMLRLMAQDLGGTTVLARRNEVTLHDATGDRQ